MSNEILTILDLAYAWGVERHVAQRRAVRWERRLGLKQVSARSPSGQLITAYSKSDAEQIIAEQLALEARRRTNVARKQRKKKQIEYEIGTANRPDVMTVHEIAEVLEVTRFRASVIVRRCERQLDIQRVEARAASTQKIIAYKRADGERLVNFYKEKKAAKIAAQKAKEKRKQERERIPQPPAPSSRNEVFYLIELWPGKFDTFKVGWTSDIQNRKRSYRTTNPHLRLVKIWPCGRDRDAEATAHALAFHGLQKEGLELFRAQDIEAVVSHIDQFFRAGK